MPMTFGVSAICASISSSVTASSRLDVGGVLAATTGAAPSAASRSVRSSAPATTSTAVLARPSVVAPISSAVRRDERGSRLTRAMAPPVTASSGTAQSTSVRPDRGGSSRIQSP